MSAHRCVSEPSRSGCRRYGGRGGGGFAPIGAQQPQFLDAAPGAYSGGRPRPGAGMSLRPPQQQHAGGS